MVKAMATGIAEAQFALDMTSLKIAKLMSGALMSPIRKRGTKAKIWLRSAEGKISAAGARFHADLLISLSTPSSR